jgi:hypothetical protein
MMRDAAEDTVLQIPNPPGEDGSTALPVPKGVQVCRSRSFYLTRGIDCPVQVIVDMVGVRKSLFRISQFVA